MLVFNSVMQRFAVSQSLLVSVDIPVSASSIAAASSSGAYPSEHNCTTLRWRRRHDPVAGDAQVPCALPFHCGSPGKMVFARNPAALDFSRHSTSSTLSARWKFLASMTTESAICAEADIVTSCQQRSVVRS